MAFFNTKLPIFRPKRSTFNLSHHNLFTCKMGKMVPISCQEVVPGDKFRLGVSALARLHPLYSPVFTAMSMKFYWFYSPYRLLWKDASKFFTGGENGKAVEQPIWPTMSGSGLHALASGNTNLIDSLSYPKANVQVSDMPLRFYYKIWDEYFRNENIQDSITDDIDTTQSLSSFLVQMRSKFGPDLYFNRNWQKDYFTASQPWTQKGNEVLVPIHATIEDLYTVIKSGSSPAQPDLVVGTATDNSNRTTLAVGQPSTTPPYFTAGNEIRLTLIDPTTNRPYNIASGIPVNELRENLALQKMLERKLRYGSRLVEYLLGVHGVRLSDKTAQRIRYVGGNTIPIQIGELLQTSETTTGQPLGQMSGTGYMRGTGSSGQFYCEEYGLMMCIACVDVPPMYINATPKYLLKNDPYDFLLPQFAHLGDQEILNVEVNGSHSSPDGVFGYIGRYDEYRTAFDEVHGDFKESLMDWHMARELSNDVALNSDFITSQPTTRIFNVQSTNASDVLVDAYIHCKVQRNLPKYAIPV